MRPPPLTVRDLLRVLAEQPGLRRRLARTWLFAGSLLAIGAGVTAVAHYRYGAPIYDRASGQPAAPTEILAIILLIGAVGAFFVLLGGLLAKWDPDR